MAPLLMLLLDAAASGSSLGAAVRRRPAYYAALAATWLLLALLIVEGPRWRSAGFSSGVSTWTYLLNQPALILRYLDGYSVRETARLIGRTERATESLLMRARDRIRAAFPGGPA